MLLVIPHFPPIQTGGISSKLCKVLLIVMNLPMKAMIKHVTQTLWHSRKARHQIGGAFVVHIFVTGWLINFWPSNQNGIFAFWHSSSMSISSLTAYHTLCFLLWHSSTICVPHSWFNPITALNLDSCLFSYLVHVITLCYNMYFNLFIFSKNGRVNCILLHIIIVSVFHRLSTTSPIWWGFVQLRNIKSLGSFMLSLGVWISTLIFFSIQIRESGKSL